MPALEESEARSRFGAARSARLATADERGRPHLVPVVFALESDTVVMAVDHKPKRTRRLRRLANIRANPTVSLLVDHYDEEWDRLWWVRADGEARIEEPCAAGTSGDPLDALVRKYPQYQDHRPQGPVVLVTVTRWRGWRGGAT